MQTTNALNLQTNNRKLFVISDLHIGHGSARDNLLKNDKHLFLQRFLDEVERHDGILIIMGDLLELWRYRCEDILERWNQLLQRLSQMELIYIPGNHDDLLSHTYKQVRRMHPLFDKLHRPFTKDIAGRRFKFMHGHEVDPMITSGFQKIKPILRILSGAFEYHEGMCLITNDAFSDILLETGEQMLTLWHKLTRQINHSALEHMGLYNETWTQLTRPIRTRNMLARFYKQQQEGLYDVTITGHTHHAGYYGGWYFNCGSWTRNIVNYITIDTDGRIDVFNWTAAGPEKNTAIVM